MKFFSDIFKALRDGARYISDSLGSFVAKQTGSELTNADREANAFTAQQAQLNRDFQQQMSNTAYQRQVTDMTAAGVNPALLYGGGSSGASTPSGDMASSVSPSTTSTDIVGLLGQIANLKLLKSQMRNIDSDTAKKEQDIDESKARIVESKARIEQIRANVGNIVKQNEVLAANARKLGFEGDQLEKTNAWIDREKLQSLRNQQLVGVLTSEQITETQAKIDKLDADTKASLQSVAESRQRVRNLLSQEHLTDEQRSECTARIAKIDKETDNLLKSGKLTDKDIEFYEWNHGEGINISGLHIGSRKSPNQRQRDKLRR